MLKKSEISTKLTTQTCIVNLIYYFNWHSKMNGQSQFRNPIYIGSILVLFASLAATWFLPISDLFKGIMSMPVVVALLSIVAQLWRDEKSQERAIELLRRQQDFALATASHMANVAFDKHVAFCEAYIGRTTQGIAELKGAGPTTQARTIANDLTSIRIQHTTWLTAEIESKLIPFETALRKIGVGELRLENLPVSDKRSQLVDQIMKFYGLVTGMDNPETEQEKQIAAAQIIDELRNLLGIKELTELRLSAVRLALCRMSESSETAS